MALRVYLDNCSFNRPFDDQSQLRVRLETEAKLEIQARIRSGSIELVWSYILDLENSVNPFPERRSAIAAWRTLSVIDVPPDKAILAAAAQFVTLGLRPNDALHYACALSVGSAYLVTTDDQLLKKAQRIATMKTVNPLQFLVEVP